MTDEYEWDFGEDVRNEYRELQDARWKESVADGRHHVSHREATKVCSTSVVVHGNDNQQLLIRCIHENLQKPLLSLN